MIYVLELQEFLQPVWMETIICLIEGKFSTNSYFFLIIDSWWHIGYTMFSWKNLRKSKTYAMFIFYLTGIIYLTILNAAFSFLFPHYVSMNGEVSNPLQDLTYLLFLHWFVLLFSWGSRKQSKEYVCICMLSTSELISKYHVFISYFLFLHIYRTFLSPFFIIISAIPINTPFAKC